MPIFRVKSVKIYTGQKKFTRTCPWRPWQIWGMVTIVTILTIVTSELVTKHLHSHVAWNHMRSTVCDDQRLISTRTNTLLYKYMYTNTKPRAVNSLWRPVAFNLNQEVQCSPWFVQQAAIGSSAQSCHQRALQQDLPYNSSHRDVMWCSQTHPIAQKDCIDLFR